MCPTILAPKKKMALGQQVDIMRPNIRHWLEYDPVALTVLLIGIGFVALLVLSI